MKKLLIFIGAIGGILTLTGCGMDETLTCTDETTANGMKTMTRG